MRLALKPWLVPVLLSQCRNSPYGRNSSISLRPHRAQLVEVFGLKFEHLLPNPDAKGANIYLEHGDERGDGYCFGRSSFHDAVLDRFSGRAGVRV
jgi:hypothetical protein